MEDNEQQADAEAPEQSAGASESALETNEGSQESEQKQQPNDAGITPEVQETINKAIGRQHAKFQTERERANTLEVENRRLRESLPQEQRPDIPPLPDQLDDDFEQQMETRDSAIRAESAFDARQYAARAQAAAAESAAQNERTETFNTAASTYMGRAEKLGVDAVRLQVAGNTIAAYGVSEELAVHILNDEKGPLITQYLAGNLDELESLRLMPAMQAAVHLATVIVPKIAAVPINSGAPAPPDGLSGGGVPPSERGPAGTTYE